MTLGCHIPFAKFLQRYFVRQTFLFSVCTSVEPHLPLLQGCQVFTTKPAQFLLKTSPMAFRGGSLMRSFQPAEMEKQPAATALN